MAGHKKPPPPADPDSIDGPSFDELAEMQEFERKLPQLEKEFRQALLAASVPELTVEVLVGQLDGTKANWAFCPHCRQNVKVDVRDTRTQFNAAKLALEYLIGKPKERKEVDITVSQKPLAEMSDDELEQAARAALNQGD